MTRTELIEALQDILRNWTNVTDDEQSLIRAAAAMLEADAKRLQWFEDAGGVAMGTRIFEAMNARDDMMRERDSAKADLESACDERDAARAECEDLRHDIERHVRIAADLATECEKLRQDAERWLNLLRGYRKMVKAVAPHFDKPITDDNIVHWLNLNNAGATIDAAIDAARGEGK